MFIVMIGCHQALSICLWQHSFANRWYSSIMWCLCWYSWHVSWYNVIHVKYPCFMGGKRVTIIQIIRIVCKSSLTSDTGIVINRLKTSEKTFDIRVPSSVKFLFEKNSVNQSKHFFDLEIFLVRTTYFLEKIWIFLTRNGLYFAQPLYLR